MIKKMVIWFCFFRGYKCPDCDRKYFAIIYIKFEKKRILILQMKIGQMYDITLSPCSKQRNSGRNFKIQLVKTIILIQDLKNIKHF